MQRLTQVLNGQEQNYIIPLFWQHGEDHDVLCHLLRKIYETGIRAVCLESRHHPDFAGEQWWSDLDCILREAKMLGMKLWIFDDSAFPTGYCAGHARDLPPELRKQYLSRRCIDVVGRLEGASFYLTDEERDQLVSVAAVRKNSDGSAGDSTDLTTNVTGNTVYWDIPEGVYRIYILYRTWNKGLHDDYMNVLDADSVRCLIDQVYEVHYERYGDEFGKTIAGFFSDEPGFYNIASYECGIGADMDLPYSRHLHALLSQKLGCDFGAYYPFLWETHPQYSPKIRFLYMDTVTKLYEKNMCGQIGDWCRAHRVEYIGHIIEDNNAHARLGYGAGHFFRALWGQDYAGIDVVLQQIMPGMNQPGFKSYSLYDGEFFHYLLAKLGSSLAHVDPKKKGRALCEIFGAYGWAEGLKLMKWLTDHMLVRGINHFMPHAFSPKAFPDPDCPPHLYAGGNHTQFRFLPILTRYINKMSHLFSGGTHVASAAVFYHGESEWSGNCMSAQKPMRVLMEHQIDADVLPYDLLDSITVQNGVFTLNGECYKVLIIPECAYLPGLVCAKLGGLAKQGTVIFVNQLPSMTCEGADAAGLLQGAKAVKLENLPDWVPREILCDHDQPYLRYYHYMHREASYHLFFNEHPYAPIETTVRFVQGAPSYRYDALENKLYQAAPRLRLAPYESAVYVSTDQQLDALPEMTAGTHVSPLELPYELSISSAPSYPAFQKYGSLRRLVNLAAQEFLPDFSGTFRYESDFDQNETCQPRRLDLGRVYETAEVWINGQHVGIRICPPYVFDIEAAVKPGKNTLRIEVTNTLSKQERDLFTRQIQQEPSGLLGPVTLVF